MVVSSSHLLFSLCTGYTGTTVGLVNTHYVFLPIPVVIQAARKVRVCCCVCLVCVLILTFLCDTHCVFLPVPVVIQAARKVSGQVLSVTFTCVLCFCVCLCFGRGTHDLIMHPQSRIMLKPNTPFALRWTPKEKHGTDYVPPSASPTLSKAAD